MTQPRIDPYIVVCSDMHAAMGLFPSLKHAIRVCKRMNKPGAACTYKPVRIDLGENVEFITTPPVPDSPEGLEFGGGGYL